MARGRHGRRRRPRRPGRQRVHLDDPVQLERRGLDRGDRERGDAARGHRGARLGRHALDAPLGRGRRLRRRGLGHGDGRALRQRRHRRPRASERRPHAPRHARSRLVARQRLPDADAGSAARPPVVRREHPAGGGGQRPDRRHRRRRARGRRARRPDAHARDGRPPRLRLLHRARPAPDGDRPLAPADPRPRVALLACEPRRPRRRGRRRRRRVGRHVGSRLDRAGQRPLHPRRPHLPAALRAELDLVGGHRLPDGAAVELAAVGRAEPHRGDRRLRLAGPCPRPGAVRRQRDRRRVAQPRQRDRGRHLDAVHRVDLGAGRLGDRDHVGLRRRRSWCCSAAGSTGRSASGVSLARRRRQGRDGDGDADGAVGAAGSDTTETGVRPDTTETGVSS